MNICLYMLAKYAYHLHLKTNYFYDKKPKVTSEPRERLWTLFDVQITENWATNDSTIGEWAKCYISQVVGVKWSVKDQWKCFRWWQAERRIGVISQPASYSCQSPDEFSFLTYFHQLSNGTKIHKSHLQFNPSARFFVLNRLRVLIHGNTLMF